METETVTAVRTETADKAVYTATFENDAFEEQVKEVDLGYYLVGYMTDWAVDTTKKFGPNANNASEYMLAINLAAGDEFKAVKAEGTTIIAWYPDQGTNYIVGANQAGSVTVYFRPDGQGGDGWHYGYLYISVPAVVELPAFKTQNLVLSGAIGVNFYLDLSMLSEEEKTGSYMTFEISGKGTTTPRDDIDEGFKNSKGNYGFTCYVNAAQMADTITATYHYGDGLTVSKEYSIEQYLTTFDDYINSFTEKQRTMTKAMADYGHYVQLFLAQSNQWTLGTDYAAMNHYYAQTYDIAEVRSAVESYAAVLGTNEDIEKVSFTLVLDSETAIKVYIKPASGYTGNITATVGSSTVNAAELQDDGRYMVRIPKISAHKLGITYTVKVTTDSGTAVTKVSGLSYVQMLLNHEAYANNSVAQNAMASIYYYYKAAYELKQ